MKKQKLLFIDTHPLGTLTDLYMWCHYLKSDYDITLLCFERSKGESVKMEGITIKEVSYKGSLMARGIRFLLMALKTAMTFKGKIFVVYFKNCEFLKILLPWKWMNLDVRTLSVSREKSIRDKYDRELVRACRLFNSVTIISNGLIEKTGVRTANLLPLGSNVISCEPKQYTGLISLLYVGTLRGRNIDQTVRGLRLFIDSYPDIQLHYDIVGRGSEEEDALIVRLIRELDLGDYVTYHGFVEHSRLKPFLDNANVGVAYVPVTEYYEFQPPTKVYEYALSGLFTIATDTFSNRELITPDNGVVIPDTPEGFEKGLEQFVAMRGSVEEAKVRESLGDYTWKNVIEKYLKPVISVK